MTARVTGLYALCDLASSVYGPAARRIDFTVEEFARVSEGPPVLLRELGWTSTVSAAPADTPWLTEAHVRSCVHTVLLPDDAEKTGDEHPWGELVTILCGKGIPTTVNQLRDLPYDISLGPRLRILLAGPDLA